MVPARIRVHPFTTNTRAAAPNLLSFVQTRCSLTDGPATPLLTLALLQPHLQYTIHYTPPPPPLLLSWVTDAFEAFDIEEEGYVLRVSGAKVLFKEQ